MAPKATGPKWRMSMGPGQPRRRPQQIRRTIRIDRFNRMLRSRPPISRRRRMQHASVRMRADSSRRTTVLAGRPKSRRCSGSGSWICGGCRHQKEPPRCGPRASGARAPEGLCATGVAALVWLNTHFGARDGSRRERPVSAGRVNGVRVDRSQRRYRCLYEPVVCRATSCVSR